jgi:hypothetical protein
MLVSISRSGKKWAYNGIKLIVDIGHVASSARPCMVSSSINAVRVLLCSLVLECAGACLGRQSIWIDVQSCVDTAIGVGVGVDEPAIDVETTNLVAGFCGVQIARLDYEDVAASFEVVLSHCCLRNEGAAEKEEWCEHIERAQLRD